MRAEFLASFYRLAAGSLREACGRVLRNPGVEAEGKVARLSGQAGLACLRARSGGARLLRRPA
ncbi:hypothetical protein [Ancylobacter lacus]|uniref:hypothetical protein n=1 Tax=Ancylobacter lacus TaxID=2579970 RepID=UPI001BCEDFE8|nr:hypothetical protein [Ancylobacter lacus]MBS7537401.1 hypothetical protein [Ancylobacter lacus]